MKKLLIMPEFTTHKMNKGRYHFPYSVWYLASYWKSQGEEVDIIDFNVSKYNPFSFNNYDWIGLSCITAQVPSVVKILKDIKKYSKAKTAVGGIHPTLYPAQTSSSPLVDEIFKGKVIKDFASMPSIDYNLLDKDMMKLPKDYAGIITSVGCPHRCNFCVNSIIPEYNKWESWGEEKIIYEIEQAFTYGFRNIFFWDDNFFVDKRRVRRFIALARKIKPFKWFAFTRATSVDRELFKECYEVGLRRVSLGGESGSDRILKYLNKDITVADTERSAKVLNDLGIEASYSYMIGLPNETSKDIKLTVEHMKRMGKIQKYPKVVGPMLYCPYPGSKLYDECKKSGWKEPKKFEDWSNEITGNVDTPYSLPWVNNRDMVQILWFYSFLIPLSYGKLWSLLWLYSSRTKRHLLLLAYPLIALVATLGKLRYHLGIYILPYETIAGRRLRSIVGA